MPQSLDSLAEIHLALAEVLVSRRREDLPSWIAAPGNQWPIFEHIVNWGKVFQSHGFNQVEADFANLPAASIQLRWFEFESLVLGKNAPPIWLHESMYVDGRIPGPTTFLMKSLYEQAGLEVVGAELADHISMELAFIAFLVRKEEEGDQINHWRMVRRLFIKHHAKKWFPQVGRCFTKSEDPAWRVVGRLLTAISLENGKRVTNIYDLLPSIEHDELCSLCGFCTRVCPTKALYIIENESSTMLALNRGACIGCAKCERICPENVMYLDRKNRDYEEEILIDSPRIKCEDCGQPMFSQAELRFTIARLGNLDWLSICLGCRIKSATPFSNDEI